MQILVTGGTGFFGRQLVARLRDPLVLTRNVEHASRQLGLPRSSMVAWSSAGSIPDWSSLAPIEAVVNLMGEPIAPQRWSVAQKKKLRDSRIAGTQNLIHGLIRSGPAPKIFISASAVGYYGNRGDEPLRETSEPGTDFLAQLAIDWEKATESLEKLGTRIVLVRIGVVLGQGGMLPRILPIFRWGLGGKLGDGKQWFPWIHELDLVNLLLWTLGLPYIKPATDNPNSPGPLANAHAPVTFPVKSVINAVAPEQVTNSYFTTELATLLRRPAWLAVPRTALRLALGEMSSALLGSQRVIPEAVLSQGFEFCYPTLREALKEILNR